MAPRRRWALLGAAALFVGGVVAALVAVGGGGAERKGQSRTTAKASGTPQQRLLALIPPFTRAKCMPAAHGVADASAIASVECGLAGLDVVYQLFPSKSVMDQWYAQVRETAGIAPSSGTCTAAAFRGEFRLVVGGSTRGRYLCVLDGRAPRLYETEDRAGVGTELDYYAGTGAPAIQSLLRQWRCCTQLRAA